MIKKKFRIIYVLAFSATLLLGRTESIAQQTVTLVSSLDNTLFEHASGGLSNGKGQFLYVGRISGEGFIRRGLVAFDLTGQVPAGATIQSARLTMNLSQTNSAAGAHSISLHKVTRSWGEGTSNSGNPGGGGAPSSTGDATWLHAVFNTETWNSAGGDFVTLSTASQVVNNSAKYNWESPGLVADVQSWADDPSSNHGWLLVGNEEELQTAKRFDTRENNNASNRPVLAITFAAPTAVADLPGQLPDGIALAQNYPNPFNPETRIAYSVSQATAQDVQLAVFNLRGQRVRTLVSTSQPAGSYSVTWDGRSESGQSLASGSYLYQLRVGHEVRVRKMVLLQ